MVLTAAPALLPASLVFISTDLAADDLGEAIERLWVNSWSFSSSNNVLASQRSSRNLASSVSTVSIRDCSSSISWKLSRAGRQKAFGAALQQSDHAETRLREDGMNWVKQHRTSNSWTRHWMSAARGHAPAVLERFLAVGAAAFQVQSLGPSDSTAADAGGGDPGLLLSQPREREDKECEAAPDEGPGAVSAAGWMGMAGVGSSGGIGWRVGAHSALLDQDPEAHPGFGDLG
eukprot:g24618.t1